jgi:chloramphenicol 3-O phosphotransferase
VIVPEYLYFGLDVFLAALPPPLHGADEGVSFASTSTDHGIAATIRVGSQAVTSLSACHRAMAELVRQGSSVVLDEVLLSSALRDSYLAAFSGLELLLVKVWCHPSVAAAREVSRADRVRGLSAGTAEGLHEGITYDLEIDTTHLQPEDCAALIVGALH